MQNILTNGHSKDLPYLQPVASSKRLGSVIGKTHPLSAPSSPAVGQRMNISLFSTRNAFQPANASTDQPREQSLFVSKRVIHSSATQCKGPRRKATQRRHATQRHPLQLVYARHAIKHGARQAQRQGRRRTSADLDANVCANAAGLNRDIGGVRPARHNRQG